MWESKLVLKYIFVKFCYCTVEPEVYIDVMNLYLNFCCDAGQHRYHSLSELSCLKGTMKVVVEGVRPSIAPCLGVEFPLGHSSREAEVSGETLLCPDKLGLQQ